jgi:hypothetical protein
LTKPEFKDGETKGRVAFCVPTIAKPFPEFCDAFDASVDVIVEAGWDAKTVYEVGNAYISAARATMLRKALDVKADVIVFLDHDLSWPPRDLLTLIETPGPVIAGTYRFKDSSEVKYMGHLFTEPHPNNLRPIMRKDGCIKARAVPAGFLKITRSAINHFMRCYPELLYGEISAPHVDLFNHGAHDWVWYGEDYGFCRRWLHCGGEIWIRPDLDICHHTTVEAFPGNYLEYMRSRPGGDKDPAHIKLVA